MKKKIIYILLITLVLVGCGNKDINQQQLITKYVKNNETLLNEINIINKMPNDIKIIDTYKSNTRNYIDFSVDEGLTSSSHYYGFYYSILNEPITIMAITGEKEEFGN